MGSSLSSIPVSLLDLAPIRAGETAADAFHNSLALAQAAERFGYHRDWFAEHHNFASIASAATTVLMAYIAGGTSRIRIGSGGIMLPNHAPLMVAEQFGTLAHLFPGRIDLGLGRAPGTDPITSAALRRNRILDVDHFPEAVEELQTYLGPQRHDAPVRAIPGEGTQVPLWLLGSSLYSAQLAAIRGLPFSFASHFAPTHLEGAIQIYRERFTPSRQLDHPYVMPCVNVIAAETDAEAEHLATSFYRMALGIIRDERMPLQPPAPLDALWAPAEEAAVRQMMRYAFIGSKATVAAGLQQFVDETGADEIMITSYIYDQQDKIASLEKVASLFAAVS